MNHIGEEDTGFQFGDSGNTFSAFSEGIASKLAATELSKINMLRRGSVSAECMNPPEAEEFSEKVVVSKPPQARQRIENAISSNLLFRNLDVDQKRDIIDAMFEKPLKAGDVIIKQGDPGDFFYVIDHGDFTIFINDQKVGSYSGEGAFGELALMYNTPRAATIQATSDAVVWCVDRLTFRKTVNSHNYRKRKLYEGFIKSVPLLSTLSPLEISKVADCLEPVEFSDGQVVIRQGEHGDHFYIIVHGTVEITLKKSEDAPAVSGGSLGRGQYFGELALITSAPRAATITAKGPVSCVSLDAKAFTRLFGPLMELLKRNTVEYKKYEELIVDV